MTQPAWIRVVIIAASLAAVELLCRVGYVDPFSLIPPSEAAGALFGILIKSSMTASILKTLASVTIALVLSFVFGVIIAAVIHRLPELRRTLDPIFAAYYSVPIFVFYPLFIILFGLGSVSQILIGFLLGVTAVIVSTLDGLDAVPVVLLRTARSYRMGPLATAFKVTLPSALPYVFTGLKLASAYAFTGVIGSEFILSGTGLGFEISNAYASFDNRTMYGLILLVIILAALVNVIFHRLEVMGKRRGAR
jgi:NitT/TauT family transport system permease protein